jgi:hypothetical protein
MSLVMLQFPADTEKKLREQATRAGQTLEAYLEHLAEQATTNGHQTGIQTQPSNRYISNPNPTQAEFDQLLRTLEAGPRLPVLPSDFSRADIYDDHD